MLGNAEFKAMLGSPDFNAMLASPEFGALLGNAEFGAALKMDGLFKAMESEEFRGKLPKGKIR